MNKSSRKKYWILYTVTFLILIFLVFGYFFFEGKSFIWQMDGRQQHFKALAYYGMWLRSILKEHRFNTFTFGLGYGGDVIQTLSYYVIGDPLNLLSVFVPVKDTVYLYDFLILVRLYLAGAAFSHYCFFMHRTSRTALLSGSLIYVFCSYALFASVRHPYFINPMIYFPLLLEGAERFHNDKTKPWLFIGMTALSAASNFYFFYMIVVMAVLYVLFRLPVWYGRRWKEALKTLLQMLGLGIIGLMMAMVFFLPVVLFYLDDPRSKVKTAYGLFYELKYYKNIFTDFIGYGKPGHWAYLGYGAVSIAAVFMLFQRKKRNTDLKAAFVLLTTGMMIPAFGSFMNGFSYPVNRWIWAYSMLVAYITVTVFDDFVVLNRKQILVILILLAAYTGLSLWIGNYNLQLPMTIGMFLIIMICRFFSNETFRVKAKTVERILLAFVICSVGLNALSAYGIQGYTKEFVSMKDADSSAFETEASQIRKVSEKDHREFVRYTGRYLDENANLLEGNSSTQYYWSLGNPYIAMFNADMALPDSRSFKYYDLDDRTMLQELASVQYMAIDRGDPVPCGYSLVNQSIYRNNHSLPLGYTYQTTMNRKQYEKLDPLEKEDALMNSAYVDEKIDGMKQEVSHEDVQKIPVTATMSSSYIKRDGNTFTVTRNHEAVTLHLKNPVSNAETYVSFRGMQYRGFSDMDLYSGRVKDPTNTHNIITWNSLGIPARTKIEENDAEYVEPNSIPLKIVFTDREGASFTKSFRYYTPEHQYYSGRHDFSICSGYEENGITDIRIEFPQMGTYAFDFLDVEALSMDSFDDKADALRQNALEDVDLHENSSFSTDEITGRIHTDQKELLCITVPYARGWDAYVNGKKIKIHRVNTMYMGLELDKGSYEIRLVYHTPGWKEGLIITCIGILLCTMLVFVIRRKEKCR